MKRERTRQVLRAEEGDALFDHMTWHAVTGRRRRVKRGGETKTTYPNPPFRNMIWYVCDSSRSFFKLSAPNRLVGVLSRQLGPFSVDRKQGFPTRLAGVACPAVYCAVFCDCKRMATHVQRMRLSGVL
eukprot:3069276-Pyramimonas_sp.AAC.1